MKIGIVAVCYNSYDEAINLIESIKIASQQAENVNLSVIVCDNSNKGNSNQLKSKLELYQYYYIKLDNIGYFPAFNRGVQELSKINKNHQFDYLIVTNVDLILDKNFFRELNSFKSNDNIGVIAPSILSNQTQEDINPKIFIRPGKLKLKGLYYGFQNLWFYMLYTNLSIKKAEARGAKKLSNKLSYPSGTTMYAAHGSIMIFTNYYFGAGATIDYPRFLFGEEVFVAEEARKYKLLTVYCPEMIVYDKEHGSTSKENHKFISLEHVKSYKYLIENYFS